MIGTPAIRNLIREDKVAQMYSAIQTGGALGMQTLDACLKTWSSSGLLSREARARRPRARKALELERAAPVVHPGLHQDPTLGLRSRRA